MCKIGLCVRDYAGNDGNGAYLMCGNNNAGLGVGGVLLPGSFYMCPTAECIHCVVKMCTQHTA